MMKALLFLVLLSLSGVLSITTDLTITSVKRSIDLRGHVEEMNSIVDIKNTGKEIATELILAVQESKIKNLAYLEVREGSTSYVPSKTSYTNPSNTIPSVYYSIKLDKPLAVGSEKRIHVVAAFTKTLVPYPASIKQNENQYVLYEGSATVFSIYPVKTQTTVFKLASDKIESWTKKNGHHKGDMIEYGPYTDIAPFELRPISIHFQNNAPFATATKLRKIIEISHFGNIAVEEHYHLRHSGAVLKGQFSRVDYQTHPNQAPASFRQITAILPSTATDLYYRDRIGNVSTSHVREDDHDNVVMEVQPRYPMLGGWKTDFYMGYNVPAHQFLSYSADSSSTYVLNITFGTPFPQVDVEDETVRIILPEGASNIQWSTPFDIDGEATDIHYTYLDTTGRPVLILNKHNVVRLHNQYFQVVYTYTPTAQIRKPLLLVFAFFLFFLASMAYARFELTIAPKSGNTSKRSGRIGTLINTVVVSSQQLLAAYDSKSADRITASDATRTEVTNALNELATSEVADIAKKIDAALTKAKNDAKAYAKAEGAVAENVRTTLSASIEQVESLLSQLVSK